MSSFTFDVGGKTAKGNVEKHQVKVNVTYRATGNCPHCNASFKVGFNPGDMKTKSSAESDLRSTIRRHYRAKHEGQGYIRYKKKGGLWG